MSVTTISGSLGLRDGRSVSTTSLGSKKSTGLSSTTSTKQTLSNNNNTSSKAKMTSDNSSLAVPSQVTPKPSTGNPDLNNTPKKAHDPWFGNKPYGSIVLTLENVLLPHDKIVPTPSALDGLDPETEMDLRIAGCELISSSGILLKLPQTAMATGQVLFQRFYYSKSFIRNSMEVTAMSCIYLASKIEEAPRRIRDVINVFHHIKQLRAGKTIQPMILDPSYIRLKSDVTLAERRVLKELGFCVHVKHPHKLIVVYMQQLGYDKESNFVQMSWNYMSDALRSNVFVRYTPEAIACACIFLSARQLKIPLPNNPAWYIVFDVEEEHIIDICEAILELYERPKVSYDQLEKKVDALVKAYQDSKQKSKVASVADRIMQGTSNAASPSSRPPSPNTGSGGTHPTSTAKSKDTLDVDRRDREKRKNDGSDNSGGRKSSANSPESKKPRRSPSPIVYDDSPQRHKKKKRRKSRSESSSPSRSRDRNSGKKHTRRERSRSRSPYSAKRQHHKKSKSHHRDRYRSRSRSYSPPDRDDRYDRGYDKYKKSSSKSSKHPRDRDEDSISSKNRGRDKDRR